MRKVAELSLKAFIDGSNEEKMRFSDELFRGLKEFGFIILKDHPIDKALLREAYALSEQLFQLPVDVKATYISQGDKGQCGYTPFGKEHAKNNMFPDLKEFWHVGRNLPDSDPLSSFFPGNLWPAELPSFRPVFERLYKALDDTGRIMLRALAAPLNVPTDFFDELTGKGNSILRLLHYPPVPQGTDPGCVRAAAHEDINIITLLVSASASGLELLTREGEWLPVETAPDNIIVDSGDMLARITNEVIPSTTHRVVNPHGENRSRYSMPFFMHPNPDAVLRCLPSCRTQRTPYPDIVANDFLLQRLRDIGL